MKTYFPIILLLGCAAAFAFGIVHLFELRFEAGDVYPAYSSLRADPLGTMALYESLGKVSGLSVRRDFSDSDELPEEPQTVYLHFAGARYEWQWLTPDIYQNIQDFVSRGGRLVITFFPQTEPFGFGYDEEDTNSTPAKLKGGKMTPSGKKHQNTSDEKEPMDSLGNKWGFHTDFQRLEPNGDSYAPVSVYNYTDLPLPKTLQWHSGIVFTNLAKSWRIIYVRDLNPVVIERKFDRGSVVIATDSYFVSNEAMAKDRHSDLLAWLIGSEKNVVFDEAHFGIVETSGVAVLMRKYRLHGLAMGLLVLAGLFIWKNSMSLVPPHAVEKKTNFVTGKDSAAGFVNLIRRSVAPRDVLATCFTEWKKTIAQKIPTARAQQAEAIFREENSPSFKGGNPIETYKRISKILGIQNEKL